MHEDIKRRDLPRGALLVRLLVRKIGILTMPLLIRRTFPPIDLAAIDWVSAVSGSMPRSTSNVGIPFDGRDAQKLKQMLHMRV